MNNKGRINCFDCKHFYTTWNPNHPRGCRAYGFRSKYIPSEYVYHASGHRCMKFEKKEVIKRKKK